MTEVTALNHKREAYETGLKIQSLVSSLEGSEEIINRVHDLVRMQYEHAYRAGMAEITAQAAHTYTFETTHPVTSRTED